MARRKIVRTRIFTVNIPPGVALDKLYDRIAKALKAPYGEAWVEKGKLYIRLSGTDYELKQAWASLKKTITELWDLYWLEKTGTTSIDTIAREIGATFPPEALVEALRLQGYRADYDRENNVLYTNAPASRVMEAARTIARVVEETRFRVRGAAAKRLIASIVAGTGASVDEVIEYGLRLGVLGFDEEEHIVLKEEWRRGIRKIALVVTGASIGEGGAHG